MKIKGHLKCFSKIFHQTYSKYENKEVVISVEQ